MALALPQYFPFQRGWCIVPEFTLVGDFSPDYLVSSIDSNPNSLTYGESFHKLSAEVKNHTAVSWWV